MGDNNKDLFYKADASGTVECKNGNFQFSEVMLCERTSKFEQLLRESFIIEVPDYDVETMKTFFDILMEFEQLDRDKSLIIFPVVVKFDFDDLLQKCIVNLKPTVMDENVIHTLNMALDLGCEELIDVAFDPLKAYGIERLFLEENYYLLLSPKSVAALLRLTLFQSPFILKSVAHWGKNYIENNNLNLDLRTFLEKYHILRKLSIDCLKTADSVLQLYDADSKMNMFTEKELLNHLKKIKTNQSTDQWFLQDKKLQEEFKFLHPMGVISKIYLEIQYNAVISNHSALIRNTNECYFNVSISYTLHDPTTYRTYSQSSDSTKIFFQGNTISDSRLIKFPIEHCPTYTLLKSINVNYEFVNECKILKACVDMPNFEQVTGKMCFTKNLRFLPPMLVYGREPQGPLPYLYQGSLFS